MKIPKQEYAPEFRELAVKRVKSGQSASAMAKDIGLDEQALRDRAKAADVGESGYRAWKNGGSPHMVMELRLRGFPASKECVERTMREEDLRNKHKRRFKVVTDSKHTIAPNLPERNFTPTALNQVWHRTSPPMRQPCLTG